MRKPHATSIKPPALTQADLERSLHVARTAAERRREERRREAEAREARRVGAERQRRQREERRKAEEASAAAEAMQVDGLGDQVRAAMAASTGGMAITTKTLRMPHQRTLATCSPGRSQASPPPAPRRSRPSIPARGTCWRSCWGPCG